MKVEELDAELEPRERERLNRSKVSGASQGNVRDSDDPEDIEVSEGFETRSSSARTSEHVHTRESKEDPQNVQKPHNVQDSQKSEEIRRVDAKPAVEPFFEQFDFERGPRADIDLTSGYDPRELAAKLWNLIADDRYVPCLFLTDAGQPVRIEVVDGEPRVTDLTIQRLTQEVHRVATFFVGRREAPHRQPCPHQLVAEMLATPMNHIPLPRLRQLATAPMIGDESGRIVFENGYHRDIGTFLYSSTPIRDVPSAPTRDDVEHARALLQKPLQDFPFVNAASLATAMAIMMTPFVRRLIKGPTPLHLIEKATPGTGASLLTDALLTPAVGTAVQKLTPPSSEHEWQYSLGAVLRALPAAVVIDNARELTSPQLAKALTDDVMVARIVGSSDTAVIPIGCVWVGTGNNLVLHQEIARRVVRCRLDAGVPKPWVGRTFCIPNLKQWLRDYRTDMVWAVLTLIRSWFVAGQPKGERVLGMFESYSEIVGGILAHVGTNGFLDEDALIDASDEDLQTEAERWLVTQWWARHRNALVTVSDLLEMVAQVGSPVLELWGPEVHPGSYSKRLGWFIRSIRDKTFNVEGHVTGGPGATVQVRRGDDHPVKRTARYQLKPKR